MTEVLHPLAPKDGEFVAALRVAAAPAKGKLTRPSFDEVMEHTPDAPGVAYEKGVVGGVPGLWCRPAGARAGAAILYLHGGAYVVGSAWAYRHFAGQVAGRAGLDAFVPDYRLAPEHPFPAAVDDARAAYRGLAAEGARAIAIVGDSAGGGLALALLAIVAAEARQGEGLAPFAGVAMSPWTDLALTAPSLQARADEDPLLTDGALREAAKTYLHGRDPREPSASPLHGPVAGLPPLQVHVGTAEILLDDARRYVARASGAGVEAVAHVWEGLPHVFPSNLGALAAADAALNLMATFLVERLPSAAR